MRKTFILIVLCAMALASPLPSSAKKQGKELTELLLTFMRVEDIHPDSLERNIDSLKQCRLQAKGPEARAVYAAAIGRLYADRRAYRSVGTDLLDSAVVWYGMALSDKDVLAKAKAKNWKPFVVIGKDEGYFGGDMLNVVWRSMTGEIGKYVRRSSKELPTYAEMIAYYRGHNLRTGALLLAIDSLYDVGYVGERELVPLIDEYGDLPLCAEVYLRLGTSNYLTPEKQREWLRKGIERYPHYKRKSLLENTLTNLSNPTFDWWGPTFIYPGKEYLWEFKARNIQSVLINGEEHSFGEHDPIVTFRDSMMWKAPKPGDYEITFIPRTQAKLTSKKDVKPLVQKIRISALQAIYQVQPDERVQMVVVDSDTGEPQPNVTVTTYDPSRSDSVVFYQAKTDQYGKVIVPRCKSKYDKNRLDSRLRFRLSSPAEPHLPITTIYAYGGDTWKGAPKDSTQRVELFTDRGIYRPGQTVHVGGIVYNQLDWVSRTESGISHQLVLFDSNYKKVVEVEVATDEMGAFSTDFEIPEGCRNGTFTIRFDGRDMSHIRVEEYKRPTFEVILEDSLHMVAGGVEVRGVARHYEGTPLRGARVTGSYRWQDFWGYYRKYGGSDDSHVLDTLTTDDDGRFSYVLKADVDAKGCIYRTLSVTVDVLSQHGETHNTSHWYWPRRDVVPTEPQPVKVDSTFLVRAPSDTFSDEKPGRIEVTTNLSDVYLFYSLTAAGEIWKEDMVKLSNETFAIDIPYEKKYDQSLTASFCFVKKGEVYTRSKTIYLERPDNKLRAHWDTFRDLLQPGQKEEWKLTLRRPDGTPADANLMVALYDASLDYFVHHSWNFSVYRSYRTYSLPYQKIHRGDEWPRVGSQYYQKLKKTRSLDFTEIDSRWFEVNVYEVELYRSRVGGGPVRMLAKAAGNAEPREVMAEMSEPTLNVVHPADDSVKEESKEEDAAEGEEEETLAVPLRENLNETAFFYPQLRTAKDGQVAIAFTLPESLTRWNLIGVAHTQDLMSTNLSEQIEARKDLMAQLYLPRFLRPGDEAVLTAIVRNVSEQPQKGRAQMQILNARTEKVLKSWKADIYLPCKKDSVFHFPYEIANNNLSGGASDDLIIRWVVEGSTCSDGEQRLLPVLPATEHITNTIAITAYDPGVTNIDLSTIFPQGVADRKLTVEYTTHPEQYALQALPVLARTSHNDVLSLATAYYAGVLGRELGANMADSTETYLQKMRDLQTSEGGFRWYPSFPASEYLTREVSYLLTRLHMLTGHKPAEDINTRAVHYLLSQDIDSTYFSYRDLRTLYVSLWSGVRLSKEEQKKVNYLLRLAKKVNPEDTGYEGQALMALIWNKDGENRKARKFVEQFKRRLVSSPEHGSYIEFPKGSFVSIDRKLHIHVQLMEALQTVMPEETQLLSGMRRYLLQQKRTQEWSTPVNSANAVFALLNGSQVASGKPSDGRLKDLLTLTRKGTTAQNFTAQDDSLGYIRDSLEIENGKLPVRLRIHKFSKGESWGGVFADFEQPFDQVTAHGEGLSVTQEYPASAKTGSRYTVRYRISADRDYEYVTLIVPRPAFTEPVNARSGYGWCNNSLGWNGTLYFYRQVHDATTEFSFYQIPRGDYLIEETLYVERNGRYHSGIAVIRCEYADEFQGHSGDCVIKIDN